LQAIIEREESMAQSFTNGVENTSEQAGRVAGYADPATETAKEYAFQAADKVVAVAKDAYDDPQRFIRETQEDLTRRTQETPLQTLAIAAGIGFVVGAIWKR
jgi:ElaB/YqjD/DUF883 family membrane-anchored ribosome-binding protein